MGQFWSDRPQPEDGHSWEFYQYFLRIINPFVWGGLGACVYILKRASDEANNHRFDIEVFRGWWIRVLLGFVLGGAVIYVIDPERLSATGMSEIVLAFLTGLSVKVVYGALEKLVSEISEKFSLDTTQSKNHGDAIAGFLASELVKRNPADDAAGYTMISDLLKARTGK